MDTEQQTSGGSEIKLTQKTFDSMRTTQRWVLFFSVVSFVLAGLSVFTAIPMMGKWGVFNNKTTIVCIQLVGYFLLSFLLFRYASSIATLLKERDTAIMEVCAVRQKSFWHCSGILFAASFILIVAVMILPNFNATAKKIAGQNCKMNKDVVFGAVQKGLTLFAVRKVESGGSVEYPTRLDDAKNGESSESNRIFGTVLDQGVSDPKWSKIGNEYIFKCDGTEYRFKYDPGTGRFTEGLPESRQAPGR